MNKITYLAILVVVSLIAGCVQSLHPLFTEKDLVFNAALVGSWVDKEGKDTWTFEKSTKDSYAVIHHQLEFEGYIGSKEIPGATSRFQAHLVKLGQFLFLDLFPEKPETIVRNDLHNFQLIPVHTFWRVWFDGDVFRTAILDNGWLKKMLDEKKINIVHDRVDNQIILTAPTKELQTLVLKYAEDDKAFPKPDELHRAN